MTHVDRSALRAGPGALSMHTRLGEAGQPAGRDPGSQLFPFQWAWSGNPVEMAVCPPLECNAVCWQGHTHHTATLCTCSP